MAAQELPRGYGLQEYRIEKLLGIGGFGLTYLARDQNLNLQVALKEYLPGEIASRGADQTIAPSSKETEESFSWGKRRFLDESRTLASFRHPNIVRVMRFFEANGSAYMVMEFVEGAPLSDWIKTRRPLPEAHLRAFMMPLLEGLEVVHKAGYTHRDIKPGNVYMREDDTPVLLDFGSARMQAAERTAIVSPGYAPFEQYHATGNQGPWSDLYAFGGVLYWMITGNRPHEAVARVREDSMPPALQTGDRDLYGAELLAAIDWALAPHEDQRPQSVMEWREALLGMRPPKATKPKAKAKEPGPLDFEKTLILSRSPLAAPQAPVPKEDFAKTLVMRRPPIAPPPPPAPAALAIDPTLLKDLETALAQHLGPIAAVVVKKAAKKAATQAELIPLLAAEIGDPATRLKFERRFSDASRPVSQPLSQGMTNPPTELAAARFPLPVLERAERRLAEHIGAVARVVVKRAAMKAKDEAELYLLLADEIEDKDDKKAFIRKAVSVSGK
jgi:serine/threonine protein kinase